MANAADRDSHDARQIRIIISLELRVDWFGQAVLAVAAASTDHQPTRTGLTWLVDHPFGFGQDLVHDRVMDRAVADDHRHPVTRRRLERPLRNWMQATFRADYFRRLCGRQGLGLGFGGLVVGIRSHSRVPRCEKTEVLRRARGFRRWVRIRQGDWGWRYRGSGHPPRQLPGAASLSARTWLAAHAHRSEERRVGKECVST